MIRFAYPVAIQRKSAWLLGALAGGALALGCTAGVKSSTGTGGAGGTSGPGVGGTGNPLGTGGSGVGGTLPPIGGFGGSTDGGGTSCQSGSYTFEPKIPTVYLLVDRSGSMFHCLSGNTGDAVCADQTNTAWAKLKTAVEAVVSPLESQVRFGFMTIWGTNPTGGGMCPSLQGMATDNVSPALNNASAIMAKYESLAFPPNSTQVGVKFESPASESIAVASAALQADTTPGDKYIIFITDGQPDYCDDSNGLCAPDSVIGQLQLAKSAGVTTVVLGLQTSLFDLGGGILQAFANAGAGEPTVAPLRTGGTVNDFYDQCNGLAGWHGDLVALKKPDARGTTLGMYSATAGPTTPYMPSASDQTMLASQLAAALSGVKSCIFDLNDINGKAIKVNLDLLNKASIKIDGAPVSLDRNDGNGWDMVSQTQLQLFGTACDAWRDPNAKTIDFNFPCEIIVM